MRPTAIYTVPAVRAVQRLPMLEARLMTFTPPAAWRVSIFPRRMKISIKKVPVPGP